MYYTEEINDKETNNNSKTSHMVVNKQYKIEDISESNRSAGNKPVIVVRVIVVVKGQKLN